MFKKMLFSIVCLVLLCSTALGEFQQISFDNITNPNTLEQILRERLGRTGSTFTFPNGLTIDNATNNAMEWNENDEELIFTFGSDIITLSTGTSVVWSFGTMIPNLDGLDVDSYVYFNPTTAPAATEGFMYYNAVATEMRYRDDSGWVSLTSGTGDNTLDDAYNQGGAGAGGKIDADNGEVEIEVADNSGNACLLLDQDDAAQDSDALSITNAADLATAVSIDIDGTAGFDIQGTGDTWEISIAGVITVDSLVAEGTTEITLANGETITNAVDTEIKFSDDGGSEDFSWDFVGNTLTYKTGSSMDAVDWGVMDAHSGLSTIDFDATAITITHTPDAAAEDLTIRQNGTTQNTSIVITTAGTGADAFQLTASAGGIDISATSSDAGDDIDITATGTSVNITATENVAESIVISSSNGGVDITAASATAGEDIDITATGSSINIISTENQANAIVIDASDAAGGIDMDCGTGTLDIDVAGAINIANSTAVDISFDASAGSFNIDAGQAGVDDAIVIVTTGAGSGMQITSLADIDITTTGASGEDIILDNNGGSIHLVADEAAATSITIFAENAAGGIDMDYGTGGMILTGTGVAANLTIDVDALSFDFTDSSNITVTSSEAGEDLTISQIGGNDSSIIITSAGQGANAIELTTSDAVGDIDINAGDAITINAGDIVITTDDAATSQFKVVAGGAHASNTIELNSTDGGILLDANGGDNGDIGIDAADKITIISTDTAAAGVDITVNGGASETLHLHSLQGTGVNSIDIDSDAGGMTITADAANGAGLLTLNTLICIGPAGTLADNATPDVSTTSFWETGAATTYTDFDVGSGTEVEGTIIIIKSLHAAVFDVTSTELEGGTTDITTASGDLTGWIYDGTAKWRLIFRMDMSDSAD